MSQYKELYCDSDWVAGQAAVSRHGQARLRHGRLPGHDTTLGRGAGREGKHTGRAGMRWGVGAGALGRRRWGARAQALGHQVHGRTGARVATRHIGARMRRLGAREALGEGGAGRDTLRHEARARDTGARGVRSRGARHGRWGRGLGVLLGCGLCTWCTQPVFDPV